MALDTVLDLQDEDGAAVEAYVAGAIQDAWRWLESQQNIFGLKKVRRTGRTAQTWVLDQEVSGRFFHVLYEGGETRPWVCAIFNGDASSPESIMEDELAWFPLIPWKMDVKAGALTLQCTPWRVGRSSFGGWALRLTPHTKAMKWLKQATRFGLTTRAGELLVKGWDC